MTGKVFFQQGRLEDKSVKCDLCRVRTADGTMRTEAWCGAAKLASTLLVCLTCYRHEKRRWPKERTGCY